MIYTLTNPKGIDVAIQNLQTFLHDKLGWENIDVYGRVYRNVTEQKGLIPEAYIADGEYRDVFLNDKKTATIFFIDDNKHETKEGIRFEGKIKIVIAVNLKKAFPNATHRADSDAEIKAIELTRLRSGFVMNELEKGIENVFSGFNTEGIKLSDIQPYHVFSINGVITYQINCF